MLGNWTSELEWATAASFNRVETGLTPDHTITPKPSQHGPQIESKSCLETWMDFIFNCNLPCSHPFLASSNLLALTWIPRRSRQEGLRCQLHHCTAKFHPGYDLYSPTPGLPISYRVEETSLNTTVQGPFEGSAVQLPSQRSGLKKMVLMVTRLHL